jgi:hypothetical protein
VQRERRVDLFTTHVQTLTAALAGLFCSQDDLSSPECNVQQRVELLVAQAQAWSNLLRGNDVLFMMGSDFEYANAHAIFANLDK